MGRKRRDVHRADKGKGHDKYKSKRPKLSFNELLAKYKKAKQISPRKVQSSGLPLKRKCQKWNWQENRSYTAAIYSPLERPIPMSYGSQPTSFHLYSSWGWFDQEAHVRPYLRPYYIEYETPRYSEISSSCKGCFDQNWSRAQHKKKMVKQFHLVK